ncbi:putative membrane protein YMR253C-like protein 2 [Colletotrichum chlorophyti]|uniref:Putative membrane protein YMR253C-like protein 2 n=1 Tax=Colletotrichum chlorophyti TaxID=708187 RepID=A0A1Q8S5W2_9PEZI|nr:putative membrane protein YMR253C-like protein 2 [Colletotrichum chlorophyti]
MNKGLTISFFERHKPSALVLISQLSAAVLNGLAKYFETGNEPVHPFQVLFIRFLITGTGCTFYLWYTKAPNFPLSQPELRPLMILRAAAGIFGAFGFYFSIMYLKLSEATALNFLGPLAAMILTRWMDFGTFEVVDRIGALVALIGVVLVVQPDALFGQDDDLLSAASSVAEGGPKGRMMGLGFGLIGVCGGAIALTAIRTIGTREHPMFSVMYFSWTLVVVTTVASFLMQSVHLTTTILSWVKLLPLGVFGFIMECLLTAGIANDSSSTATIMIYSQVAWALLVDWVVWRSQVDLLALFGIGSVVTSLIVVSSAKEWNWLRKGRYATVAQVAPAEDEYEAETDEEMAELNPTSSVA